LHGLGTLTIETGLQGHSHHICADHQRRVGHELMNVLMSGFITHPHGRLAS
jgi:hypothetical protein